MCNFVFSVMALSIRTYTTVSQFLQDAAPFLRPFALENNRILGTCTALSARADAVLPISIVVLDALKVKGVAMLVDSVLLIGYRSTPEAINEIAQYIAEHKLGVASTMALTEETSCFTSACELPVLQRIPPVEGNSRMAGENDLPLLDDWLEHFFEEAALYPPKQRTQLEALNRQKLQSRQIIVWEVDGSPVSTSAIIRTTPDVAIVGHVYTPPAMRGKGYSAACVYALCSEFHKRGHDRFGLFVDEQNYAARKVYERIGFSLQQHCRHVIFA
jgi:predicted GNAT family acetyltransferase